MDSVQKMETREQLGRKACAGGCKPAADRAAMVWAPCLLPEQLCPTIILQKSLLIAHPL